MLFNWY